MIFSLRASMARKSGLRVPLKRPSALDRRAFDEAKAKIEEMAGNGPVSLPKTRAAAPLHCTGLQAPASEAVVRNSWPRSCDPFRLGASARQVRSGAATGGSR